MNNNFILKMILISSFLLLCTILHVMGAYHDIMLLLRGEFCMCAKHFLSRLLIFIAQSFYYFIHSQFLVNNM